MAFFLVRFWCVKYVRTKNVHGGRGLQTNCGSRYIFIVFSITTAVFLVLYKPVCALCLTVALMRKSHLDETASVGCGVRQEG